MLGGYQIPRCASEECVDDGEEESPMKRLTGSPARGQKGITGLETAIIPIAFVVAASVFALTVLSTGVFSFERGKETIFAGLGEAQSSMSPRGFGNRLQGHPV